jgi:hypothetical protein
MRRMNAMIAKRVINKSHNELSFNWSESKKYKLDLNQPVTWSIKSSYLYAILLAGYCCLLKL